MRGGSFIAMLVLFSGWQGKATAVPSCGGVSDSCQCGADNPYPCCNNGNGKSSNCTWGSWHHACCDWGKGLPGWSHAKYWAGNAASHPDYDVKSSPESGSIGCRKSGYYGHVAYVTGVNGSNVSVHEMSCCEGTSCWPGCSYCINGFQNASYNSGYFDGGYIVPEGAGPVCGDGSCNGGENCSNCSGDCGKCCGNGKCDYGEDCNSCSKDCGSCPYCGDGKCASGESCKSCPKDCGSCCGNGKCDNGEDCESCSKDCGKCPYCGDGKCSGGESCKSCKEDCGKCCGNGDCDYGETCESCSKDCGKCCGNGDCDYGETCESCSKDCGKCCGNGKCDYGETCDSCEKDCGDCCGNGSCDHGETCESCEKDCGPCNHPPVGYVERADCGAIAGWAEDPDSPAPVDVIVRCNGVVVAQMQAGGDSQGHPGHGFYVAVGHELKNSQIQVVEVIAIDDKGEFQPLIDGSGKQFLCRNGIERHGIWTIEHQDSAAVDIFPFPLGESGLTTVQLRHPGGTPYPNSGRVTATASMLATPFEKVQATVCGAYETPLYVLGAAVDGVPIDFPGPGTDCRSFDFPGPGNVLRFLLEATQMVFDDQTRVVEVRNPAPLAAGWSFEYSFDASGVTASVPAVDQIRFQSRQGDDAASCQGFLSSNRVLPRQFDGVSFGFEESPGGTGVKVRTEMSEAFVSACQDGVCILPDLPGTSLSLVSSCPSDPNASWESAMSDIRVFRSFKDLEPPWELSGDKEWGLRSLVPPGAASGLACRVESVDDGFVPTGAVRCDLDLPEPGADALAGILDWSLPGECFRGFVTIDGKPVRMMSFGKTRESLVLEQTADAFGIALTATQACSIETLEAFVEVSELSYRRLGWWTTPSSRVAGIASHPTQDCSLEFENQRWWGMAGNESAGTLLVHRKLNEPFYGIRYGFDHDFEAPYFKFRLALDGKPAKEHPLLIPSSDQVAINGTEFSHVSFQFMVTTGGVYPYRWNLRVSDLEVLDQAGQWQSICLAGDQAYVPLVVGQGEDVFAAAEAAEPDDAHGGDRSRGCNTFGGPPQASPLPLAILLVALFVRPRREVHLP